MDGTKCDIYMSFKCNEEEGPSVLGVSLCDRHGALQRSVIINTDFHVVYRL